MEIRCSHAECIAKPFSKCLCSDEPQIFCKDHMLDHILNVNEMHRMEKVKVLSSEEIKNNRIEALETVYSSLESVLSNLIQKLEALYKPKINKFMEKINSNMREINDILNYLDSDHQDQTFFEKFRTTFEDILEKFEKNTQIIADEINSIEDVAILFKETSWKYQLIEEEKTSDYIKLASEIKPLKLDELYANSILRFFDYFDKNNLKNSFYNLTNFCNKENILSMVIKELTDKNKDLLYEIVLMTREDKELAQSGSNSMSILVKAGYKFYGTDLSEICIPQANLSHGVFYKTNFTGSDLSHCNLSCAQFLDVFLNRAILPDTSKETSKFKIHSLAISHSESWVAVCQGNKVVVYDAYNSKKKNEWTDESTDFFLQIVSWSYDDKYIASCDWLGTIFIWLWGEKIELFDKIQSIEGSLTKVLWAPTDYKIASCSSKGKVKIWNAVTKENIFENNDVAVLLLAWSSAGNYLAFYCWNDVIWVWKSEKNQLILSHKSSEVYSLEWIYDEEYLVFGGKDGNINIFKISNEEIFSFANCSESPIKAFKWMDKLSLLAVGDFGGSITIWSVNEHEDQAPFFSYHIELFIFCHSSDVSCLAWSWKNNLLVSGSADGTFKVWQILPIERKGKIGNTETTQSIGEDCQSEADSSEQCFIEELLWCSEASHFIHAKARKENFHESRLVLLK